MAKVKVDMRGVDPEESMQSDYAPCPTGIHKAKIISCDPGYAKGEDGKPDKSRPKLTVVFRVVEGNYSQLWYHLSFSDKEYPRKKMDQFLQTVGILSKTKRTGEFDTDSIVNKIVNVTVAAERDRQEYTPRVVDVLPATNDDDDLDLSDDELDEEFTEEDTEDEEELEEELYTEDDLKSKSAADLRAILKGDFDITSKVRDKAKLIELILEAQGTDEEEDDDDLMDDEDEEMMEDEEQSPFLTEAQLKAASVDELKGYAKDFDLSVKGKTKAQVIAAILEAQGADEEPF